MSNVEYKVTAELGGARLDKALVALAKGASRASVKRAIDEGGVRVNGRRRSKGDLVVEGDVITIASEHSSDGDDTPVATPGAALDVRLENGQVIVVDKPAGQATAPLRAGETGTLANALITRFPELAGVGYVAREPGLLHRLDTDTSGLLIVARTSSSFDLLKRALKSDLIKKKYLLLCREDGLPDAGTIEYPLASHPKDQRRVYACIHPRDVIRYSPRDARTDYRVVDRIGGLALVEVTVARAVRHQIRIHFAALGHPLIADTLYGGPPHDRLTRQALHASEIAFAGDGDVAPFFVQSSLPSDIHDAFYGA